MRRFFHSFSRLQKDVLYFWNNNAWAFVRMVCVVMAIFAISSIACPNQLWAADGVGGDDISSASTWFRYLNIADHIVVASTVLSIGSFITLAFFTSGAVRSFLGLITCTVYQVVNEPKLLVDPIKLISFKYKEVARVGANTHNFLWIMSFLLSFYFVIHIIFVILDQYSEETPAMSKPSEH